MSNVKKPSYSSVVQQQPEAQPQASTRKRKKQPKVKSCPKFNVVDQEDEPYTAQTHILIHKTRRTASVIPRDVFIYTALIALKDGACVINRNPYYQYGEEEIMRSRKHKGNYTIHNGPLNIFVKMNTVFGPTEKAVHSLRNVDICGCDYDKDANPELVSWISRIHLIHLHGRYPCITNSCVSTFPQRIQPNTMQTCPICNVKQCPKCCAEWSAHADKTCMQFRLGSEESNPVKDEFVRKKLINGEMQPCPKCSTLIEKTAGCNKMACETVGCGSIFCWTCGDDIRRHADAHDHWYRRECPIGGMFSEDYPSYLAKRTAIIRRNIQTFGELLSKEVQPEPMTEAEFRRMQGLAVQANELVEDEVD